MLLPHLSARWGYSLIVPMVPKCCDGTPMETTETSALIVCLREESKKDGKALG